ncbi:FAD-dependent thymidylate synthase [bacterium]|nr:FAD-dependent thymidylate synthase [bacterium]
MEVTLLAITPQPEKLIEAAGRTAYLSFEKVSETSAGRFCRMLLRRGHESVLEHASATFRVRGGSRAFTHQLVRHRLAAFTQQSQRYVEEKGFEAVMPESIRGNPEAAKLYEKAIAADQQLYDSLRELGIPREDARFILPNAAESELVITANLREWRHIITLRGARSAQWEIRRFAVLVLEGLAAHAPNVFADFQVADDGSRVDKIELKGKS